APSPSLVHTLRAASPAQLSRVRRLPQRAPGIGNWPTLPHARRFLSLPPVRLVLQPQGGGTTAVVEGRIRRVVLHVGLPGTGDYAGVCVHIVLLRRHVSLHVKDELFARL